MMYSNTVMIDTLSNTEAHTSIEVAQHGAPDSEDRPERADNCIRRRKGGLLTITDAARTLINDVCQVPY